MNDRMGELFRGCANFKKSSIYVLLLLIGGFAASPSVLAQGCGGSCPLTDDCSVDSGEPPEIPADPCMYYPNDCPNGYTEDGNCCVNDRSPIIFDLSGDGFHLSNAAEGVWFRPYPNIEAQYKVAWPKPGVQNGWLALDRNHNGKIDDFSELFGNATPQPPPAPGKKRNGFAALAVFDALEMGGNDDGWITKEDRVFSKLRIWWDKNHDGVSQADELLTLDQVGVKAISLNYENAKRIDEYGNVFRYRGKIKETRESDARRVIFDVFLGIGERRSQDSASGKSKDLEWPARPGPVGFTPLAN